MDWIALESGCGQCWKVVEQYTSILVVQCVMEATSGHSVPVCYRWDTATAGGRVETNEEDRLIVCKIRRK